MRTSRRALITLAVCGVVLATLLFTDPASTASTRDVVVSEIAWMGTTVYYGDEWIELYNNTGSSINLSGWTLAAADGTPTIALSGSIPAGGYFLLERTDDTTVPGVAYDQKYTGDLGNDGEDLVLRDAGSVIVDRIDCSGGWYAGHNEARVPMVRVDLAAEGSLAENWTYNPRCGTATNSIGEFHECVLSETPTGTDLAYEVYFNDLATTATGITTDPTEMENRLLALIDGAQSSIDIALYGLDRQSVIDALIEADEREVTVRVVGDDRAAVDYSAAYQQLVDAGLVPVLDASTYIQHNKFLVVDGQVVWTGSTNFTDTGFTLNANNSLVITDTTLASIYTLEFEEMWSGVFHKDKADNTDHLLDYNGTRVESFFSPTDLVAFEVWGELAGADESLHFAMFYWTDPLLADRAIARLGDGVTVMGIWDQMGIANAGIQAERMCDAGVLIGTEDLPGKVHHKFAIIDVYGSDPTVILGSYNWTDPSGAYENDENTLIVHDAALALAYYQEWQRLWGTLTPDRICNAPVVFVPLVAR